MSIMRDLRKIEHDLISANNLIVSDNDSDKWKLDLNDSIKIIDKIIKRFDKETNPYVLIDELFSDYDELITRINKNARDLVVKEAEYQTKSEELLNEARKLKAEGNDIISEKYGGNNDKTRKQYVKDSLMELGDEIQEIKFQQKEDGLKLSYQKRLIDMQIQLIKYQKRDFL